MFVNNEHDDIAVVVTCIANPSLSSHAHASHSISRVCKNPKVVTISTSIFCGTTIIPAPYSLSSAAQAPEQRSIHPSRPCAERVTPCGPKATFEAVVRSTKRGVAVAELHVDTPTSSRERAMMPKGSASLRRACLRGRVFS